MQIFQGLSQGGSEGAAPVGGSVGTSQGREDGEWSLPICAQGCLLSVTGTLVVGTFLFLQSADYQRDLLGCLLGLDYFSFSILNVSIHFISLLHTHTQYFLNKNLYNTYCQNLLIFFSFRTHPKREQQ